MFQFFKENILLILAIASGAFLLVYGIIRVCSGSKGTWSKKIKDTDKMTKQEAANTPSTGSESRGEARARNFLESYFKKPFIKARPYFLNNDVTGGKYNLEIDCYNEELKLGVEYNGRQHYEYVPFFHSSREAFYNQKYRDKLKQIYCAERGIKLIEIPYTELGNLENWLQDELIKNGFNNQSF